MAKKYCIVGIEYYRAEVKDRTVTVTANIVYRDPSCGFGNIHDCHVTASATCHPNDTFDFATGVALATLRIEKQANDFIFTKNEALY